MNLLLISHIALFSLSLVGVGAGTLIAAAGTKVPNKLMRANLTITVAGFTSGLILLANKPLGAYCAMLTAYVIAFAFAQRYMTQRNQRLATSSDV